MFDSQWGDSPGNSFDEIYSTRLENWFLKMSHEFEDAVKDQLHVDSDCLDDIATALALIIYDYAECNTFTNKYGITPVHALCYLHCTQPTQCYQKAVIEAYEEFLS